jgi:uncharacterized protein YfaS (alpha-2-macroglobulin family)
LLGKRGVALVREIMRVDLRAIKFTRAVLRANRFAQVALLFVALAACATVRGGVPQKALPAVSPLPSPTAVEWIAEFSPRGEAQALAQIRVIFKDPLIPLQAIEDPSQRQLALFSLDPPLPGRFRFLTPRMVGFQLDRALPLATRIRVTLHAGLSDLAGHSLSAPLSWTFTTAALAITDLPNQQLEADSALPQAVGLKPTIGFRSNVELDQASLAAHLSWVNARTGAAVPVAIAPDLSAWPSASPGAQQTYDVSQASYGYLVTPNEQLEKSTRYRIVITRGLMPAAGNLASDKDFSGQIKTYGPLAFDGLGRDTSIVDRFYGGRPFLRLSNPLVADSVPKNLSIFPMPPHTFDLWQVSDGDNTVAINTAWLAPQTAYTITIGSGIADSFGQTLGTTERVKFFSGDLTSNFWMPDGINIFPASDDLALNISAVNLVNGHYSAFFKVLQPADVVAYDNPYPTGSGPQLLPDRASWPAFAVKARKNQVVTIPVALRRMLGGPTGMLAYGAWAATQQNQPAQFFGFVGLTNLGVFAQWFPSEGLVRVEHLSNGSDAARVRVDVYSSSQSPCAGGTTDATGTLILDERQMHACLATSLGSFGGPALVAVAREGADWAFARTYSWSGGWGYGIDTNWDRGDPVSRGTIYSDRALYQPGEKAEFTGAAYYLQRGVLYQDRNAGYDVSLTAPDGSSTHIGRRTTDAYGMFSFPLALRANQPLGYYAISAKGRSGVVISGDFRVAEFKPPNFTVALSLDKDIAFPGDMVLAQARSNYLFGAAVSVGQGSFYVTRQQTQFTPKGLDDYSFGRQWFWPEQAPSVPSDVLQTKQTLSGAGTFQQAIKVDVNIPYPLLYQVDAQVVDVSNLSVADSKTFTVLPGSELIGLQTPWIATARKPIAVQFVVSDPRGALLRGRRVTFTLDAATFGSAAQVVEGGENEIDTVTYKTVASARATSASGAQTVSLTPPSAGIYRIRANFTGAKDDATASDAQLWVTGPGEVNWAAPDRNVLQVRLDKKSYRIGETATALIASPYPQGQLYFAVIRNKILQSRVLTVSGSAPEVRFRVTPDMMPNAAVEAVLVRRGRPLQTLPAGSIDSLARTGFAPFSIDLGSKYLTVKLLPQHATLQPGGEQTVRLQVRDGIGLPMQGELAVMVVNQTILQLTGYRPPDLVQTVYAPQFISTVFADNRPNVLLQAIPSPLEKGYGYGGGFLAGAASTLVRSNFQPLAYYNGALRTDSHGVATFSFRVPDDLTTWHVMAVAVAAGKSPDDFRFGNADATFVTSKPLVTNPVLPQFVRPGDQVRAGLSVTNLGGLAGTLDITGTLSGPLVFKPSNGGAAATASLSTTAPSATAAYRFTMDATAPGSAQVKFQSTVGSAGDAFQVALPVRAAASTMESVVESGVTPGSVTIPLNVGQDVATGSPGLQIDLASTLLPEITVPAGEMLEVEALPFAEPQASRLLVSAELKVLAGHYGRSLGSFSPDKSAAAALAQLAKLQRVDGGFSICPCFEKSDVLASAYVGRSLGAAHAAGIALDPAMFSHARTYLEKALANTDVCGGLQPCLDRVRLDVLAALAEMGEPRTDFLSDIYARRGDFDLLGRAELARYLLQFPSWRAQGLAMANALAQVVYVTGRFATANYPSQWQWFSSAAATQAQALRLFVSLNDNPELIDKLAASLLALRRNRSWGDTYDTAEALSALAAYAALQPQPPNFSATATLGGNVLQSVKFSGYTVTSARRSVPLSELPQGSHPLVLTKMGQGRLHYFVQYTYRLQGPQPGQIAGLRLTRYVREAGKDLVLAKMGLNAPNDPLNVEAGGIFDVALELITDHPIDHVVISDELPTGFEAVDTSFKTSTNYFQALGDNWTLDYQQIYRDRIVAYVSRLDAGVYTFHYLVRSVTPGTFGWPAAQAQLQYAPEQFGRTSTSTLVISE